ncbi:hypothetical protein D3C80_1449810 [compost metagenome]
MVSSEFSAWSESRLPFWSTTVTCDLLSSGTAVATRLTMDMTWPGSSERPEYNSTSTEALGLRSSRTNTELFGIARCTRAALTLFRLDTVRASSPSRPRR